MGAATLYVKANGGGGGGGGGAACVTPVDGSTNSVGVPIPIAV